MRDAHREVAEPRLGRDCGRRAAQLEVDPALWAAPHLYLAQRYASVAGTQDLQGGLLGSEACRKALRVDTVCAGAVLYLPLGVDTVEIVVAVRAERLTHGINGDEIDACSH